MSRLPNSSTVFATAASTLSAFETSPWTNFAPISSATSCDLGLKSKIMTFAPSAMKFFAVARPSPDPPPVMNATLSSSCMSQSNL
nr:hypothetical protein [Arthrobacter sp. TB 26]